MRTQIGLLVGCALVLMTVVGCQTQKAVSTPVTPISHELDGQSFTVKVMKDGKFETEDTLIFADGTFRSTACDRYGYGKAAYETTGTGKAMTFKAASASPKYGVNHWTGTIKGNKAKGGFAWKSDGKTVGSYTFSGSRAK
ncbi:MAG: hypothetical protein HQ559_08445 [Lentisphaerae bacterium]|nr:hypothetical protein [Lentisphaerota bacterium]